MRKSRDHKAEYARRIANAAARGLSRSQARGHAKAGEATAGKRSIKPDPRFEEALKLYRENGSRAAAAKAFRIAPERFSRFLADVVQASGRGKSTKITDNRPRDMLVFTNGDQRKIRLRDFDQAVRNGEHRDSVKAYLSSGNADLLIPFHG